MNIAWKVIFVVPRLKYIYTALRAWIWIDPLNIIISVDLNISINANAPLHLLNWTWFDHKMKRDMSFKVSTVGLSQVHPALNAVCVHYLISFLFKCFKLGLLFGITIMVMFKTYKRLFRPTDWNVMNINQTQLAPIYIAYFSPMLYSTNWNIPSFSIGNLTPGCIHL